MFDLPRLRCPSSKSGQLLDIREPVTYSIDSQYVQYEVRTVDSIDFTLDGTRYTLTRDMVIKGMRRQKPGRIQTWAVDIEGVTFPVKQVLAQALGIPASSFISTRAQDLLSKLGFSVTNTEDDGNAMSEHAGAPNRLVRKAFHDNSLGRFVLAAVKHEPLLLQPR